MVNGAFLVTPLYAAEIVTTVFLFTDVVVTVKLAVALPVGTVTVEGTVALLGLLTARRSNRRLAPAP